MINLFSFSKFNWPVFVRSSVAALLAVSTVCVQHGYSCEPNHDSTNDTMNKDGNEAEGLLSFASGEGVDKTEEEDQWINTTAHAFAHVIPEQSVAAGGPPNDSTGDLQMLLRDLESENTHVGEDVIPQGAAIGLQLDALLYGNWSQEADRILDSSCSVVQTPRVRRILTMINLDGNQSVVFNSNNDTYTDNIQSILSQVDTWNFRLGNNNNQVIENHIIQGWEDNNSE